MAKANVTIVEAQMGEGKTNTSTAILIDDYFRNIKAIVSPPPQSYVFPVAPYKLDTVKLLPLAGQEDKEPKIITIPRNYSTISDTKIFANYHLYGIKYVLCDPLTMLQYLNTGVISHGKLVIDEAYISGEARRGMNTLSLIYTWFAQQMRKRDIELYLLVQHGRFIDWRFRYIAKQKILCRYNEKTYRIKLLVQNLSKGSEKMLSYYAPQYWKYFDTNELPPVPEKILIKGSEWT